MIASRRRRIAIRLHEGERLLIEKRYQISIIVEFHPVDEILLADRHRVLPDSGVVASPHDDLRILVTLGLPTSDVAGEGRIIPGAVIYEANVEYAGEIVLAGLISLARAELGASASSESAIDTVSADFVNGIEHSPCRCLIAELQSGWISPQMGIGWNALSCIVRVAASRELRLVVDVIDATTQSGSL